MSDTTFEDDAAYHLLVEPDEAPVVASALRLLIDDMAHEPDIRRLAREVLVQLDQGPQRITVTLSPGEMKVTHSALRLLLNDLSREQADEREQLWQLLGKLPDEHAIRAIQLP